MNELIDIDLSTEERELLWQGLQQWGGPASGNDEVAQLIGFKDHDDLLRRSGPQLMDAVRAGDSLSPDDWHRALAATELVFISNVWGAAGDWAVVTPWSEQETLILIRRVQQKLAKLPKPEAFTNARERMLSRQTQTSAEVDLGILARDFWAVDRALWGPGDQLEPTRRNMRDRAFTGDLSETRNRVSLLFADPARRGELLLALLSERGAEDEFGGRFSRVRDLFVRSMRQNDDPTLFEWLRARGADADAVLEMETWLATSRFSTQ